MQITFIPLDYETLDIQNKSFVKIFGRTSEGKTCCVFDHLKEYFYVTVKEDYDPKRIQEIIENQDYEYQEKKIKVISTELTKRSFLSKEVNAIKISVSSSHHIFPVSDALKKMPEVEHILETDISPITKYIIEKKFVPLVWQNISGKVLNNEPELLGADSIVDADLCLLAEKIEQSKSQQEFIPKVLSFDIEADEFEIGKGEILMISVSSNNFRKVLTWKKASKKPDFVEYVKDEADMIEKFIEYVNKVNPDIITGYFTDGFDLPYLRARAENHKIKLSLGLDNSQVKFQKGRITKAKISGRVHVDMFRFIDTILAPSLKSETISLNEVANEILSEKKLDIDFSNGIENIDLEKFYHYNLQDSILTEKLFNKLWPNIQELVKLTQEPMFTATRDSYSQLVESYILHNLSRFNELAPNKPSHENISERRQRAKYEGAFVKQPIPGLYENIVLFDFTSLYPSIISSFNISPASLTKDTNDCYKTPEFMMNNKESVFYFKKKESHIPILIKEIINMRKAIKKQLKQNPAPELKARSYALKTIMNAAYGYYAYFGARYYCIECAASTAAFGRFYIKKVIDLAEKQGFKVIYGDTDSIAIHLNKKTKQEAIDFLKTINNELPGEMELELEDFYKRGLFVSKRTVEAGAKKKYALINESSKIKIRGFETVRRDWCMLAKSVQDNVIKMILNNGNEKQALSFLQTTIKDIKERKIEKKEMIIKTQLKKPIEEYKSISPHVTIAKKMRENGIPARPGTLIEYYIAETNSEAKNSLVRDKAKLPNEKGEYNIKYYLEHQIIPAVENIFEIFSVNTKEACDGKKQKCLFEY